MSCRAYTGIERLTRYIAYTGGAALLGVAGLVVFEVIARRFLGFAITGVDELSGYIYAISMAWGFSFTLLQRGHIRVDFVYVRLHKRIRAVLDIAALLSLAGLMSFLSLRVLVMLQGSISLSVVSSSPLQIPLWIPQSLWLGGLAFFSLCSWLLLFRSLHALVRGNYDNLELGAAEGSNST